MGNLKEDLIVKRRALVSQIDSLLQDPMFKALFKDEYRALEAYQSYHTRHGESRDQEQDATLLQQYQDEYDDYLKRIAGIQSKLNSQDVIADDVLVELMALKAGQTNRFAAQYNRMKNPMAGEERDHRTLMRLEKMMQEELQAYIENELKGIPRQSSLDNRLESLKDLAKKINIRRREWVAAIEQNWELYDTYLQAFEESRVSLFRLSHTEESMARRLLSPLDKPNLQALNLKELIDYQAVLEQNIQAYKEEMDRFLKVVSVNFHVLWVENKPDAIQDAFVNLASMSSKRQTLETFIKTALVYDNNFIFNQLSRLDKPYLLENTLEALKNVDNSNPMVAELGYRLLLSDWGLSIEEGEAFLNKPINRLFLHQIQSGNLQGRFPTALLAEPSLLEPLIQYVVQKKPGQEWLVRLLAEPRKIEWLADARLYTGQLPDDQALIHQAIIHSDDKDLLNAMDNLPSSLSDNPQKKLGSLILLLKNEGLSSLMCDKDYTHHVVSYLEQNAHKSTTWVSELFPVDKGIAPISRLDVKKFKAIVDALSFHSKANPQVQGSISAFERDFLKVFTRKDKPEDQLAEAFRLARKHFRKEPTALVVALNILQAIACIIFPIGAAIYAYKKHANEPFWKQVIPKEEKIITQNLSQLFKAQKEALQVVKEGEVNEENIQTRPGPTTT